jgi:beta-phosphoglucomutase
METPRGFIFDLDGVVVDTATFHFLAWSRLAKSLGFELDPADNDALKGVSRMAALDHILQKGGLRVGEAEKAALAEKKNAWYREYLADMDEDGLLPNARGFIEDCRGLGIRTAIASASRNAGTILAATGIAALFDAVVDGYKATRAKPAPDVFLLAAEELGLAPSLCLVFEDAPAGVEGAIAAGMACIGIGEARVLSRADLVLPGFEGIDATRLLARLAALGGRKA